MKRLALRIVIASVVVSALIGIWALLQGDFGKFEIKVLMTSLCISGASILALACAAAWHGSRAWLVPPAGLVFSIAGFASLVFLMWVEARDETAWKCATSLIIVAVALANASLLSLRRLPPSKVWLLACAYVSSAVLVGLILIAMWGEIDGMAIMRWIGVFTILLCAFTILVALFQRIGARAEAGPALPEQAVDVRYCPFCGAGVEETSPQGVCSACGAAYRVTRV